MMDVGVNYLPNSGTCHDSVGHCGDCILRQSSLSLSVSVIVAHGLVPKPMVCSGNTQDRSAVLKLRKNKIVLWIRGGLQEYSTALGRAPVCLQVGTHAKKLHVPLANVVSL